MGLDQVDADGTISSINIDSGGFGYANVSDIKVLVEAPSAKYEDFESVEVAGDFGYIIGIEQVQQELEPLVRQWSFLKFNQM